MATDSERVNIFTDGSCLGNPGPGGWAAIVKYSDHEHVLQGRENGTTNNRMELTAALEALKSLPNNSHVFIYTDSQYLKLGVSEWLPNWKQRNWKRKGGALANIDLWQALDKEINKHDIQWMWVKGHNGHSDNERADKLSRSAISKRI